MTSKGIRDDIATLPPRLRFVFAPLVKRALGIAVGSLVGGGVFLLTMTHLALAASGVTPPIGETPSSGNWLWYLQQYFYGYSPSLGGAFIGLFWGFWAGFVAGFFVAALRNLMMGIWILAVRTKAQLFSDRDFLDHI